MKTRLFLLVAFIVFQGSFANSKKDSNLLKEIVTTDPIALNLPNTIYCDPNNDGFGVFDLTVQTSVILAAQSGAGSDYAVAYYETLTDAEIGAVSSLASPYANINPWTQTIYYRVTNVNTNEYAVGTFQLVVNPTPEATAPNDYHLCDLNNDGMEVFDFTVLIPQILGALNSATTSVTFYTSLAGADSGFGPITAINSYTGSNGEIIWARVEVNSTGCYDVVSFQLHVLAPPAVFSPTPLNICDSDANPNDQFTTFDLTVKNIEIIQLLAAGETLTYYPSLADAWNDNNAIADPTSYVNVQPAVQTLGVKAAFPLTGCASYTTLDIRVSPLPYLYPPTAPYTICDTNQDGAGTFNLDTLVPALLQGSNVIVTFHETLFDAYVNGMTIPNPTQYDNITPFTQTIYVRGTDPISACYTVLPIQLEVNPAPETDLISNNTLNTVYVDGSNTVVQPLTLDAQLYGDYSYQWSVDGVPIPDATFSTYYVNTASENGESRTFSFTVEDLITGCASGDSIIVEQSSGVPSPLGLLAQAFNEGDTLADLTVSGSNVLWYASETNKVTTSTPLPLNTILVNETTYYASQTIGGIESIARLPVTVHAVLEVPGNEILPVQYAPNPVKNSLTLQSAKILKSVLVYTMLGQKVYEQSNNTSQITIDFSHLAPGNYIVKIQGETEQKIVRIIKE